MTSILLKLYFAWLLLSMVGGMACEIMNTGHSIRHWTFRLGGYFLNSAGAALCFGVTAGVIAAIIFL